MSLAGKPGRLSPRAKLLILVWVLTLPLVNPWVRGDGVGYYAYIHASLIRGDLNFKSEWQHANPSFRMGRVNADGQLKANQYTANGHVINHFAVGPAMLWAPFLVPAHGIVLLLDRWGWHIPANGYSRPYVVTMGLATCLYGFLAVWLGFVLARDLFDERVAFVAALGIWFGSSLPVYMYFNPSWAHAQAAFVVALFLWYWRSTGPKRTLRQWIWLGLAGGLMLDVYYPNVVLFLLPLADALGCWTRLYREPETRQEGWRRLAEHSAFVLAVVIAFLPTLVTRAIIYGSPFQTGYGELWSWTSPKLLAVLFSSDHGLFSWTPLLAVGVVGLLFLRRRDRRLGGLLFLVFVLFYYLIACYQDWAGISSFGNRFFISLTAIFLVGLAAFLDGIKRWSRERRWVWRASCAAVGLLVIWNLGFIFQWGTQLVPERGPISWRKMAYNQIVVVPQEARGKLKRYFLNRGGMMRRIEQHDMKTLKEQGVKATVPAAQPSAR